MTAISGTRRAMASFKLSGGEVVLVDEDDLPLVCAHTWSAHRIDGLTYAATNIRENGKAKTLHMHRLLMNPRDLHVDHINGDGLDNRRSNLRLCTNAENRLNSKIYRNNTSGAKGVSRCQKTGKWYARIAIQGKRVQLGRFETVSQAAAAYSVAAVSLHGDFRRQQ